MASIVSKVRGLSLPLDAVRVDPHEPNPQGYIWVALVFSYANMTGDDFADVMKKLIDKRQILDFHKRVARAVAEAY